jgi:hypothetical protein
MKAGTMKTGALKRDAERERTARKGFGEGRPASLLTGGSGPSEGSQESGGHVRGPFRHDVEAFGGNAEPAMVDVLNEPIVHSMMRRDGVAMDALQDLLRRAEASVSDRAVAVAGAGAGAAVAAPDPDQDR